jgi:hypothetical protein
MNTTELRAKIKAVPTGGLFFRLLTRSRVILRRRRGQIERQPGLEARLSAFWDPC